MPFLARSAVVLPLVSLTLVLSACGGGSRSASAPQQPVTTVTAAQLDARGGIEKILVTEKGAIAIVERDGCMAMVREVTTSQGPIDEIQTRCAKPERIKSWFEGTERVTSTMALEAMKLPEHPTVPHAGRGHALDDDEEIVTDPRGPATAKVLTTNGRIMRVTSASDVTRLNSEVRALAAELAGGEQVTPGPASEHGWQMVHVSGPARVMFAGTPTRGTFDARMSTTGQYLCEFTANFGGDSPLRATKSGWLKPSAAVRAIDVVLGPWNAQGAAEKTPAAYAAATKAGTEQRSNPAATAAVFALFSEIQEALGDACLPELESPSSGSIGL